MPLKLMYTTNDPTTALAAESAGVDRIFVDMETLGKEERQKGMDTKKSFHTIGDVALMRRILTEAELLVRVDPIHPGSKEQIERTLEAGADIIMLPMWKSVEDVTRFLELVGGRCRTILLLETKEAVGCLDAVLALPGIDMVHIGLNDLHLSYGMNFMFEPLADGTVERICARLKKAGVPYGFGGVSRPNSGMLPAEHILGEHVRLGSQMAILSRSFCDVGNGTSPEEIRTTFREGLRELRACESSWEAAGAAALEENRKTVRREIAEIAARMRERNART